MSYVIEEGLHAMMLHMLPAFHATTRKPSAVKQAVLQTITDCKDMGIHVNPSNKYTNENFAQWATHCFILVYQHLQRLARHHRIVHQVVSHGTQDDKHKLEKLLVTFGKEQKPLKLTTVKAEPNAPLAVSRSPSSRSISPSLRSTGSSKHDFD